VNSIDITNSATIAYSEIIAAVESAEEGHQGGLDPSLLEKGVISIRKLGAWPANPLRKLDAEQKLVAEQESDSEQESDAEQESDPEQDSDTDWELEYVKEELDAEQELDAGQR
jgi:hypothetical protein